MYCIAYLWRKIEPQVAAPGEPVLYKKRYLLRQAEFDRAGQATSFAEIDEIFEGEGECNRFGKIDRDILVRLLDVGVWSNRDTPVPNISLA